MAKDPVTRERKVINIELVVNSDEEYCAVHLINRGWRVEDKDIIVEFSTTGNATGFLCSVNREEEKCKFIQSLLCDFTWTTCMSHMNVIFHLKHEHCSQFYTMPRF